MSGRVAIVDYGMGNLFSVLRACEHVGLPAEITADPRVVEAAPAIILPGVGAFGDAMGEIGQRGLLDALREWPRTGKPFLGVCLGLQLMMEGSSEFGRHAGLGFVRGSVNRFEGPHDDGVALKVPQIGWNAILPPDGNVDRWRGTPLEATPAGADMYFVHSFYAMPADSSVVVSTTRYGQIEFCSSLGVGNMFGCQFHPERSGPIGLEVYRAFAGRVGRD